MRNGDIFFSQFVHYDGIVAGYFNLSTSRQEEYLVKTYTPHPQILLVVETVVIGHLSCNDPSNRIH